MTDSDATWLSTAQAAQALRLSQRQVVRYCEDGRLVHRRAGRRLLIRADSVATLADELAIDVPKGGPPARRSELPAEVVRYLQEQGGAQRDALDRLARIESKLEGLQPPPAQPFPLLLVVGIAVAAAALVAIVVLLAVRL